MSFTFAIIPISLLVAIMDTENGFAGRNRRATNAGTLAAISNLALVGYRCVRNC